MRTHSGGQYRNRTRVRDQDRDRDRHDACMRSGGAAYAYQTLDADDPDSDPPLYRLIQPNPNREALSMRDPFLRHYTYPMLQQVKADDVPTAGERKSVLMLFDLLLSWYGRLARELHIAVQSRCAEGQKHEPICKSLSVARRHYPDWEQDQENDTDAELSVKTHATLAWLDACILSLTATLCMANVAVPTQYFSRDNQDFYNCYLSSTMRQLLFGSSSSSSSSFASRSYPPTSPQATYSSSSSSASSSVMTQSVSVMTQSASASVSVSGLGLSLPSVVASLPSSAKQQSFANMPCPMSDAGAPWQRYRLPSDLHYFGRGSMDPDAGEWAQLEQYLRHLHRTVVYLSEFTLASNSRYVFYVRPDTDSDVMSHLRAQLAMFRYPLAVMEAEITRDLVRLRHVRQLQFVPDVYVREPLPKFAQPKSMHDKIDPDLRQLLSPSNAPYRSACAPSAPS